MTVAATFELPAAAAVIAVEVVVVVITDGAVVVVVVATVTAAVGGRHIWNVCKVGRRRVAVSRTLTRTTDGFCSAVLLAPGWFAGAGGP